MLCREGICQVGSKQAKDCCIAGDLDASIQQDTDSSQNLKASEQDYRGSRRDSKLSVRSGLWIWAWMYQSFEVWGVGRWVQGRKGHNFEMQLESIG